MSPRAESFLRLRGLVAKMELDASEVKKRLAEARQEMTEVAKELSRSEQEWVKKSLGSMVE